MKRSIFGVTLDALASSVPKGVRNIDDEADLFGGNPAQISRIKTNLGLGTRRVADSGETSLDLCIHAARAIFEAEPGLTEGIEILVFVTQTPDHFQPANACIAHAVLNLPVSVACLDVSLGCSGFVYGLWTAASMLCAGYTRKDGPRNDGPNNAGPRSSDQRAGIVPSPKSRRALILSGDTVSRALSPLDRSVAPIFGDGGSAAIISATQDTDYHESEESPGKKGLWDFHLFSDGTGKNALIIPAGAYRIPSTPATREPTHRGDGITRSDEDLAMDGGAVMSFTLREVPPLLRGILDYRGWTDADVDLYALHQANRFILSNIAKAAGLTASKLPWDIGGIYGNQSSASIPVTICHHLGPREIVMPLAFSPCIDGRPGLEINGAGPSGMAGPPPSRIADSPTNLIMAGFGVGLSWGACACDIGGARILPVLEMPSSSQNAQ